MEKVIRQYGKFLLAAAIIVVLIGTLFFGITDAAGNRGILKMIGAQLKGEERTQKPHQEFQDLEEELCVPPPEITCSYAGELKTGEIPLLEYIRAIDSEGVLLPFQILCIKDPAEREITEAYQKETGILSVETAGLYLLEVSATDAGNRKTKVQITLPVNW